MPDFRLLPDSRYLYRSSKTVLHSMEKSANVRTGIKPGW
jgi:hypothetical protein